MTYRRNRDDRDEDEVGQTPERPARWAVAAVLAVLVAGAAIWLARPDDERAPARTTRAAGESATATPPSTEPPLPAPAPTCASVAHPFAPRHITVPGVTRAAAVVAPPRVARGVPGVPPITDRGKTEFAWDRQAHTRPGDEAGNVLLNAHTWPDGSALGNRLLAELRRGDRIVVLGDSLRMCYRVTERVEVLASRGLERYYADDGPPQLAIVVCSGRRLGPGVWTKRTVWFASPAA